MSSELDKLIQRIRSGEGSGEDTVRALVAALKREGAGADETIRQLLGDADEMLRWAALLGCQDRGPGNLGSLASDVVERSDDRNVRVRRAVAKLLGDLSPEQVTSCVDKFLHDDDGEVCAMAIPFSVPGEEPRHRERLVEIALRDEGWGVRQAAVTHLRKTLDPDATSALMHVIAHDDDSDVAKSACESMEHHVAQGVTLGDESIEVLRRVQERISSGNFGRRGPLADAVDAELGSREDVEGLNKFGLDLTAQLEQGKLPRGHDVDAMVDSVCRVVTADGNRSAVLVGPTGAGKTAVINEVVARLAQRGWRVVRVSPADILAGTLYLGEWQTKVRDLVGTVRRPRRVVVFVPNLEELSGAGRTRDSSENVATALAPYIEDGTISVLGETTRELWQSGLGGVGSLRRLFQRIDVKESDPTRTRRVLTAVRNDSGVDVPDDVLQRLTELADFYLAGVAQPGRSVGLLKRTLDRRDDDAGPLRVEDVLETLSVSTGVPRDLLDDRTPLDCDAVRRFFEKRVMGQDEAVEAVADLVTLVKAGLNDPEKPFGVLLFVGPTGVGKTELARALASYIFGDVSRLLRLDMSEYAAYEGFQRLIGADGSPGTLTGPVREHPFSVVLLDEIEKAHPTVFDLCLQLFDAGRLTDGRGRTVDFRRTIIILTSNVGAGSQLDPGLGFGADESAAPDRERTLRELGRTFRPEFLNRLDRIVSFLPLTLEVAERIARREVASVIERSGIQRRHLAVDVDPPVIARLLDEGYSQRFGARPLNRTVERRLLLPLARTLATGRVRDRSTLRLTVEGKDIHVRVIAPHDDDDETARVQPEGASLRARTATLGDRVSKVVDLSTPLRDQRTDLLKLQEEPGFWNDRLRASDVLDRTRRFDDVLAHVDELDAATTRLREWALAKDFEQGLDRFEERLATLEAECGRLQVVVRCKDETDLADAFVCVDLVNARGVGLDGVGKVAGMYRGLARRRGLEAEVLDDRQGNGAAGDGLVLVVTGGGAYALLAGETGHHELVRRSGGARSSDDRDVVRVHVLPVPTTGEDQAFKQGVRVETRRVPGARGRLVPKPELEIELFHEASRTSVRARTAGPTDAAIDQLRQLLRARVDEKPGGHVGLVRRYVLGAAPKVRDVRTGVRTGRLDRVLDGQIDRFLVHASSQENDS